MNKKKLFSVLFAALMLAVFAAPANATNLDENMCVNTIHGDWISSTCFVNGSYNFSVETINITGGITLKIFGILGNFGTINTNDGGILDNFGYIYNAGMGTININDGGTFSNVGTIINYGTIFIACGGTFVGSYPGEGFLTFPINCVKSNPVTDIQNLINDVEILNIQHGVENSLVVKLNAAIQEIQANNNAEAINSLQAFINEVNALRGKKITESEADILIAEAQAIISQLTGP